MNLFRTKPVASVMAIRCCPAGEVTLKRVLTRATW